jgi:hypothetical protein
MFVYQIDSFYSNFFDRAAVERAKRYFYNGRRRRRRRRDKWCGGEDVVNVAPGLLRTPLLLLQPPPPPLVLPLRLPYYDGRLFSEQLGLVLFAPPRPATGPHTIDP